MPLTHSFHFAKVGIALHSSRILFLQKCFNHILKTSIHNILISVSTPTFEAKGWWKHLNTWNEEGEEQWRHCLTTKYGILLKLYRYGKKVKKN